MGVVLNPGLYTCKMFFSTEPHLQPLLIIGNSFYWFSYIKTILCSCGETCFIMTCHSFIYNWIQFGIAQGLLLAKLRAPYTLLEISLRFAMCKSSLWIPVHSLTLFSLYYSVQGAQKKYQIKKSSSEMWVLWQGRAVIFLISNSIT